MSLLGDGVDYTKVIFGQNAMHHACRLVLQDMGSVEKGKGKRLTIVVGYIVSEGEILTEKAREIGSPHELIVGDLVIRPHQKYTGREFIGSGAANILTGGGFDPENWECQSFPEKASKTR